MVNTERSNKKNEANKIVLDIAGKKINLNDAGN